LDVERLLLSAAKAVLCLEGYAGMYEERNCIKLSSIMCKGITTKKLHGKRRIPISRTNSLTDISQSVAKKNQTAR